ncbi:MAG: type II toxin-antitoxin system RelE/ParE family toxin [Candidatus Pacearchaeota archaeon]|jgi:mRNA interferase RelE/StbE
MKLNIDYENQPEKFLKRLDKNLLLRIFNCLERLKENPVPSNAKRMKGHKEPTFRIRIGKYRILYRINYENNLIVVVKIDKRERVYD